MPKTAAVLLNYNDAENTVRACERLLGFSSIDHIILVDNASTDGSREKLRRAGTFPACRSGSREPVPDKELPQETTAPAMEARTLSAETVPSDRIVLVLNDRNGGYGYGNNRGVETAKTLGCAYVLIANPDAVFTEGAVQKLKKSLEQESVAASGALMEGARFTDCAWPLLPFAGELAYAGPFTKRLFRRNISYPRAFFRMLPAPVGAVHGSFFMVKTDDFLAAGGFDERVFLFMEEKILGQRMASVGKQVVLTDATYRHAGSASMEKAGLDRVKRQKERQKAERFYYKNYLGAGVFAMLLARLQQWAVLLETKAAAKTGRI